MRKAALLTLTLLSRRPLGPVESSGGGLSLRVCAINGLGSPARGLPGRVDGRYP